MPIINEPIIINAQSVFNVLPKRNIDKAPVGNTIIRVGNIEHITTHNTGAVTVTDFSYGADGQEIVLLGDGNTTVQENLNIVTNVGDLLLEVGKVYRFVNFQNIWYYECCNSTTGGGGLYVLKAGDDMSGTLYMNGGPQIIIGNKADSIAHATITNGLHTQLVFDAPNVNMIGVSNTDGASAQWSGTTRSNMFSLANADGGIRWWMNYHQTNSTFGVYETHRPSATWAFDSAGILSYKFVQPNDYGPTPYGSPQTLIFHGAGLGASPSGGVNPYDETDEVNICTMQANRKLGIAISAVDNAPINAIRLDPTDANNRVELFVAGALRRVQSFNDGAGHNVLFY